jgi:hypothetical protein
MGSEIDIASMCFTDHARCRLRAICHLSHNIQRLMLSK